MEKSSTFLYNSPSHGHNSIGKQFYYAALFLQQNRTNPPPPLGSLTLQENFKARGKDP